MMITILLFAHLQEAAGRDRIKLPIEEMTVRELKAALQKDYPSLALEHVMTAVNEGYARDNSKVAAGDTVAFIPPVSGG